ncbi:MAG TPA: hypothetical protein VMD53_10245 [Rhizomicrobium sp.]|nr:hypothetical protein [Rhizomicrobium sp.]
MNANEFVERYVAVWNEPDESVRRARVAELWARDGAHFTNASEARGHEAIAETIARIFDRYVGGSGFNFRALNGVDAHHSTVKFYWALMPAGGGMARAVISNFLVLDDEGRIRADYEFIEP